MRELGLERGHHRRQYHEVMGKRKETVLVAKTPVVRMERCHVVNEAAMQIACDGLVPRGDQRSGDVAHEERHALMPATRDEGSAPDDGVVDASG